MNQETQHGYLILADISGYTSYLVEVELAHALMSMSATILVGIRT
jgi:hypothetical protein